MDGTEANKKAASIRIASLHARASVRIALIVVLLMHTDIHRAYGLGKMDTGWQEEDSLGAVVRKAAWVKPGTGSDMGNIDAQRGAEQ